MIYLIPTVLAEDALETILPYVLESVKKCSVIFAENERTARRFLKKLDAGIVIDHFEWHTIHKAEAAQVKLFGEAVKANKNIAIISEAGCPGVADPGQLLIAEAHRLGATVRPLVGPSSILLALMASGLNGQNFGFQGYLPIDDLERAKKIKTLEVESGKQDTTQIIIETPFRNNKMLDAILKNCRDETMLSVAFELTSAEEWIKTQSIKNWKQAKPDLHKKQVIFLLKA